MSNSSATANLAPFRLHLEGIPAEAYTVHRWRYVAALDEPYTLTVVLHVARPFAHLFGRSLGSRLNRPDGLRADFHLQAQAYSWQPLHGAVSDCALGTDHLAPADAAQHAPLSTDLIACTLTLRPRLWWASLATTSRSFQRTSVQDVLREVLQCVGFSAADLEFRLSEPALRHRYRQQYQETDLAFVSRLLEHEGWAYFFEQQDEREVMVVTDSTEGFSRPAQWSGVRYRSDAGLNAAVDALPFSGFAQVLQRFERRWQVVPTEHRVDDFNYRSAEVNLQADGNNSPKSYGGFIHSYGSHAKTPEEGQLRARQQAERYMQHGDRGTGHSTLPALAPGQCIGVVEGPSQSVGRWLILSVQAQGDRQHPYANQFTAQPEEVPYRPEWDTPLPDMAGVTHMRTDTTDAGNPYARLDPHGRYLAWHYFEHQSGQNGLGSAPLRLARDYAGPTYGQHFPVHADVEALAGYVHGDPDRPVLLGVVHDSRHVNHVTSQNPSRHVLRTWANNKLRMEDQGGQEHVKLSTEYGLSQLNLGHLVNQEKQPRGEGFELRTEHEGVLRAQQGWLFTTHGTNVRGDPKGEGSQMHNEPLQEHINGIRPWADNRSKAATQVGLEAASSLKQADKLQEQLKGHTAPLQAIASPAGIVLSARQDVTLGAEQAQGFYSQGAINLTSSEPLGITAKKGIRIHAEAGGLKQVISDGDYTVHVQDGDLNIVAKDKVQIESKSGVVRLQTEGGKYFVEIGPKGIRTNAKEVKNFAGVKIDFTGGPVAGVARTTAGLAEGLEYFGKMEVKDFAGGFVLKDEGGRPITGAPYTLKVSDGRKFEGVTDAHGNTELPAGESAHAVEIFLGHEGQGDEGATS